MGNLSPFNGTEPKDDVLHVKPVYASRSRGSRTSRRASPARLKPSTARAIAPAELSAGSEWSISTGRASLSMMPHEGPAADSGGSLSGAMKPRVPFKSVDLAVLSSSRLLIPKSPILTHHCWGGQDLIRIFCICSQIDASAQLIRLGTHSRF